MIYFLFEKTAIRLIHFLGVTLVIFMIMTQLPGDPVTSKSFENEKALNQDYFNLEQPTSEKNKNSNSYPGSKLIVDELKKYFLWVKKIIFLDFGYSSIYKESALDVFQKKVKVSLLIFIVSLGLLFLLCIPIAMQKSFNSDFDKCINVFFNLYKGITPILSVIFIIKIFTSTNYFNWLPLGDSVSENFQELSIMSKMIDVAKHLFLPVFCIFLNNAAEFIQFIQFEVKQTLKMNYIITAKSKGLSASKIKYVHILRNIVPSLLWFFPRQSQNIFMTAIIVEPLLNIDGIVSLVIKAVKFRDYNLIMTFICIYLLAYFVFNLLSELLLRSRSKYEL